MRAILKVVVFEEQQDIKFNVHQNMWRKNYVKVKTLFSNEVAVRKSPSLRIACSYPTGLC